MVRRHLLALVVAVALLALVAGPPTGADAATRDPCAGAPKTVAAEQAGLTGVVTADGYVPVPLPDGRTAWLMSDTFASAIDGSPALVHNSIVVQRGHCFTPLMGGDADVPNDLVPEIYGVACWQSAGVARARTLVAFCTDVVPADGPPGFGFQVVGSSLATFDLPGLTFVDRVPLPVDEPAGIRWGTGAVRHGTWVYVYGRTRGATDPAQYVARVRVDRITTGPWRFWTGRAWGERDALRPMTFAGAAPAMPAFVTATNAGYVAVAFSSPLPDPTISGWTAATPQGPWRRLGAVATAVTTPDQFAYDARAVDLGRAGWAIVYNVNASTAGAPDPSAYGGRFATAPRRVAQVPD